MYEDGSASTAPELKWFWSIVVYVRPDSGIVTSGRLRRWSGRRKRFGEVGNAYLRVD